MTSKAGNLKRFDNTKNYLEPGANVINKLNKVLRLVKNIHLTSNQNILFQHSVTLLKFAYDIVGLK